LAGQALVPNQQLGAYTAAPASSATPYGGRSSPCARLMAAKPVQAVYGPGTFLNQAVTAVNKTVVQIQQGAQQQIRSAAQAAYQLALSQHRTSKQAQAAAKAAATLASQQEATQAA